MVLIETLAKNQEPGFVLSRIVSEITGANRISLVLLSELLEWSVLSALEKLPFCASFKIYDQPI